MASSDICASNILMDSSQVVLGGFYYASSNLQDGNTWKWAKTQQHCWFQPVKYSFIDFKSVSFYPEGLKNAWVLGLFGQYTIMPKLSLSVLFDPFNVDIFAAAWTILAFEISLFFADKSMY